MITIPPPVLSAPGPDFKIIPDSELVYGPASAKFDVTAFIKEKKDYLSQLTEEVEGQTLTGIQIVQRVAEDFSVNPRLLLAVLEYRSGWLTQSNPSPETLDYPIGITDEWRKGLYQQLSGAANNLNRGYYQWRVNAVGTWSLADGTVVPISSLINAGTAGVQQFFALLYGRSNWEVAIQSDGLFATYNSLFGYPFDFALEPLLPVQMEQPLMQLPFEANRDWAYTGGPHGSWGDGSAWGALDFAPGGDELGCVSSDEWVVAVADGPILRAANGAVIQDLNGYAGQKADGLEQTGWVVLYMHIESRDWRHCRTCSA